MSGGGMDGGMGGMNGGGDMGGVGVNGGGAWAAGGRRQQAGIGIVAIWHRQCGHRGIPLEF